MSLLNYSVFYAILACAILLALVAQMQINSANASQNKLLDVPELQSDNNLTTDSNNSTEYPNNSTEFTSYKDDDFGFEILYPSDWNVNTKDLEYELATFFPLNREVSIAVKLIPREKHETLKQFGDNTFKKSDAFRISEYYRNPNTTFAGQPAIKMIGTFYYNPNVFQQAQGEVSYVRQVLWQISLLENQDAFFGITYFAADRPNFKEFLPIVQKMIDSVKLTNMKPQIIEED